MTLQRAEYEIETFSGQFVNTDNPDPATIKLEDIAHALANTGRWGGHSKRFYSVAEHAVFVSVRLERLGYSRECQCWGLHHDDHEAYFTDVPRPIKPLLKGYAELTTDMDAAIAVALALPTLTTSEQAALKDVDTEALWIEARDLLPSRGKRWQTPPPEGLRTPNYYRGGLTPDAAEMLYLARHKEVTE
jgi:hypothetical protein